MADVYSIVTEKITTALEAGTVPWQKPWAAAGLPRNLVTKKPYRGMNVMLLSLGQPFHSPYWLTLRQANEMGGKVREGERSSLVTFWKFNERRAKQEDEGSAVADAPELRLAPILRYYLVFNVEQCEGIEAPSAPDATPQNHDRLDACEAIVSGMPKRPKIVPDGRQAFYVPASDYVGMPDLNQFDTAENYYATLFHELTHSTGHESRLNRHLGVSLAPFGSPDYSKEELVAEFGASFLCAVAGIFPRVADHSASYIDGWLKALKGDKRLLPIAAAQAQKAADFILGTPLAEQSAE